MTKLGFGYQVPDGTEVAWGARLIVTQDGYVDFVPDRTSVIGEGPALKSFLSKLGSTMPPGMLRNVISSKLAAGEIKTREAAEIVILEDNGLRIVGNSNASAGYFYLAAYPSEREMEAIVITSAGN